jgi:hypothetical protein
VRKNVILLVSAAVVALLLFVWITRDAGNRTGASPRASASASAAPDRKTIDVGQGRAKSRERSGGDARSSIVSAVWGGGAGELGRDRPDEASPSGPMSFAVDARQRMWVLDQVNGRIVRYRPDGSVEEALRIAPETTQDIAVSDDGTVAVLDRFGSEQVALYDQHGNTVGMLPLTGQGVETAGHVTGIFVDGEDVYAETEHGPLWKLGTTNGEPAEPRDELPGRPSKDGTFYVKAGIVDAVEGRAYVAVNDRPSGAHRFTRELTMGSAIQQIVLLDTDMEGTIYFGSELVVAEPQTEVLIVCLDSATGEPQGTVTVPANDMPEETFKDYVVPPDGGVIYAHRTSNGVEYKKAECSS